MKPTDKNSTESKQLSFNLPKFDISWKDEWIDMPEFIQEDLMPFRTIMIHFKDENDINEFACLIQQKITPKKNYLWFPPADIRRFSHYRYIDVIEEQVS